MMGRKAIRNLDVASLLHDDDVAAKKVLDVIHGFKAFMLNVVCPLREKYIAIEYVGDGLKVTEESLPELDRLLTETCQILDNRPNPEMSLRWHYDIAATTEGAKSPHITALSGAVDLLEADEIRFVLGHKIWHQICGHKP